MARNRLYWLVTVACVAGYSWLCYQVMMGGAGRPLGVCMVKQVTTIPCPSCGVTRSILAILKADYLGSFQWNPLGWLVLAFLLITPLWLLYDLSYRTSTLHAFYYKVERAFRNKYLAIPAIGLVFCNWIWNIYKGI